MDKVRGFMTRSKSIKATIVLLFLLFYAFIPRKAAAEESNKVYNILILNSYHQGLVWSMEESEGILHTLSDCGINVTPLVEYIDWKNYPEQENLDYLYEYFTYKYKNKTIDTIITTDDMALEFALKHREDIFSDAPIVFCGVNQSSYENIIDHEQRVTGVLEVIDPTETINFALSINPDLRNVYLVYDNTESGLSTGSIITEMVKASRPELRIIPCNNMSYEELISQVRVLDKDSIIYLTSYYSDVNKNMIYMDFVTRELSSNSHVPIYHLYDFGLGNGALGGTMLSGRLQGESAAKLALRIIQGERAEDIPVIDPKSTRTAFDYRQMERFGISERDLPEQSEIINKPFSFFEAYKILVIFVIAVFVLLLAFIFVLIFNISKIKRMKETLTQSHEKLAYLAYYDSLTGLPNKLSLYEDTKSLIMDGNKKAAFIYLDIDNFKYVNDTLGHAVGDHLIMKVGERLSSLKGKVYRLSGDEFIMFLSDVQGVDDVESFAESVLSRFTEEFEILNIVLHISVCFGIVLFPEHGTNLDQLLQYADIAMYRAKELGRKRYVIYDHIMNKVFKERADIEKYLHTALDNNEFDLHYQPQYDLRCNRITGLEALLRWNNPVLGNVSPMKFIKVAEDTHIIVPVGTWVLQKACSFLKELNMLGFDNLTMSVNISILQLLQNDFCDIVSDTIRSLEINPQNLELEITETMLVESFESIIPKLEQLRNMQIRIALDDFGKGYSSLNYLKQLPIDTLKVDKSFIDSIIEGNGENLTGHIVMIGKSMGLCIVAEGVEKEEQLDYLIRHECDKMQGYLYCKPKVSADIVTILEQNK